MQTTSPWLEQLAQDIPGVRAIIAPEAAEAQKQQRAYRFNAVHVPLLRLLGFGILASLVYLHDHYILAQFSWPAFRTFGLWLALYCGLSWGFLAYMYSRVPRYDAGAWVFTTDIFVWTVAIYHTGGEQSWLFFFMILRVADQAYRGVKPVVFYAHVSVASYVLMLLYIHYVDQRPAFDLATLTKILCLYATNLYLASTARAIASLRRSARAAIHLARECITRLDAQAQQLHEHATQLALAKHQAEEAHKAKHLFLANLSHELLTPLNGVIGMTSLTLTTPLSPQQRGYLTTAQTSASTLVQLIHSLLDFASLEAGQRSVAPAPFVLRAQLAQSLTPYVDWARTKGVHLTWTVAPDVPEYVVGDARCVDTVLACLVDNAIKFTAQGTISVAVIVAERTATALALRFAVQDTGIGIPLEKQHLIFEAFAQVDSSSTRPYGGTGLGLAVATQLVQLQGGQLWVESQEGQGSTFAFTIQCEVPPRA